MGAPGCSRAAPQRSTDCAHASIAVHRLPLPPASSALPLPPIIQRCEPVRRHSQRRNTSGQCTAASSSVTPLGCKRLSARQPVARPVGGAYTAVATPGKTNCGRPLFARGRQWCPSGVFPWKDGLGRNAYDPQMRPKGSRSLGRARVHGPLLPALDHWSGHQPPSVRWLGSERREWQRAAFAEKFCLCTATIAQRRGVHG